MVGQEFVLRATIDTEVINRLVRSLVRAIEPSGDAFIINGNGVLQTPSRLFGAVMEPSSLPSLPYSAEANLIEIEVDANDVRIERARFQQFWSAFTHVLRNAIDHGIDVIYVSNHGGRQLDHVAGSMAVLPEVVEVVAGKASVMVDGGICRGTDIAKALALGADGVGLGRMMCLALAAAGPDGIVRMLELLETELAIALALLGVTHIAALERSHVTDAIPLPFDHALHSAFPLLGDFRI